MHTDKTIGIEKLQRSSQTWSFNPLSKICPVGGTALFGVIIYSLLLEVALSVNVLSATRNGKSENGLGIFLLHVQEVLRGTAMALI